MRYELWLSDVFSRSVTPNAVYYPDYIDSTPSQPNDVATVQAISHPDYLWLVLYVIQIGSFLSNTVK